MFAGAAREAVFSKPDVIRRINADFVPVALKAALVNNPPNDAEGRLYREMGRSKPAPQGICVANSAGKVLAWSLMFDDDPSVLAFLDHSLKRFREYPDAKQPVASQRFMRFPSQKLPDVADQGAVAPAVERHPAGVNCPANPGLAPGSVVARVFGRALDAKGQLVADTVSQESYVEDRFAVPPDLQDVLAKTFANAGTRRVRIPDGFARLCTTYAYLGQLDVRPLSNPRGDKSELRQCEFWAQKVASGGRQPPDRTADSSTTWRVDGKSAVFTDVMANAGPGDLHEVELTWAGFIEMDGNRITRLLLSAGGTEKLKFGSARGKSENDVASLPAGRRIDMACDVRYGIIGAPAGGDELALGRETGPNTPQPEEIPKLPPDDQPAGIERNLMGALGPQFAVFLPIVQDDLKLSADQKKRLEQAKTGAWTGFQQFMQQVEGLPPAEREKKMQEFRQEADRTLAGLLAKLLTPEQQKRLRQIMLQQQGLFALADPQIAAELKFGDEQQKRFLMRIIQETQKRLEAFQQKAQETIQQKAQATGNPEEVQKVAAKLQQEAGKIRRDQEAKIEALLTEGQKDQWKAMLGKPLPLEPDKHPKE